MKFSDWLGHITTIAIIVCLGVHMGTLYVHGQRMNVLSCRIDIANARVDTLRGEPAGDTTCADAALKKSKAADLRSYDLHVPATKPL